MRGFTFVSNTVNNIGGMEKDVLTGRGKARAVHHVLKNIWASKKLTMRTADNEQEMEVVRTHSTEACKQNLINGLM